MKYPMKPLGDISKIVSGSTPDTSNPEYWNGDISWVTPADLTNNYGIYFESETRKITKAGYSSCSTTLLPLGSILFSSRAPIGHCAVTKYPLCTNQGFKNLIPHPELLDSVYGYYALRRFTPQIVAQGRGATFAEVNAEIMKNFCIPLPPLDDQKRIAAILEEADHTRRSRRFTQSLSDTFLQETFVEMFGDPVTNPMEWERIVLGDVITSAKDGPHVSPQYVENGIPFLSTRNVRAGQIIWDDLKFISWKDAQSQWKKVKPAMGDILYTKGGTTGLAKAVDFDLDFAVWVHLAVLKLRHDKIVPVWLENMLNTNYCYQQSQQLTFGIVNRDLGLKRMPKIEMYLPPINLQEDFAAVVKDYSQAQMQQQESARQAEHLFQTLLHRAFRGEL